MSTSFSYELTYDAPLADVAAMLADPEFRKAVCDAQHALSRSVTVNGTTASGSVAIDYTQAATGVPSSRLALPCACRSIGHASA